MINEKQPDVIIGTESWLTSNHNNSEYFPTDVHQVEERDRPDDLHGGIFIAAKLDLALVRETELEADCEMEEGMKRFWSFIKHQRTDQVQVILDPIGKANVLNSYFHSLFTREAKDCDIPRMPTYYPVMQDVNITSEGVTRLIKNVKVHKAPSPDGITPQVMKELSKPVSSVLTTIYRKSYETGEIPGDWKRANVASIFKKGSKQDPNNYRPISLTCISCKLLEHIITSSIMRRAHENSILYSLHHGFRDKRSCETQLLGFVNDLTNSMHEGYQTDVLIMNFSKAFDKVNHCHLVAKLCSYGICRRTSQWIQCFLEGRTQSVVLDGEFSDSVSVLSGVPQGSVLGPCLFLFYISDLTNSLI